MSMKSSELVEQSQEPESVATLNDDRITLKDVFLGALPFAAVMLVVLILLICFPALTLAILN